MKKTGIAIVGLLLIIATAAVGFVSKGFMNWDTNAWKDSVIDMFTSDTSTSTSDSSSIETSIVSTATMTVKALSSGTDTNGNATKTFSYTVTPTGANDQSITVYSNTPTILIPQRS